MYYEIIPNLLFPLWLLCKADRSQSAVLKSNLQTPTWLLLISHGLFITAITSPHIFILLLPLLHCCWPALLPLFLHLTDLTFLPPSWLPPLIYSLLFRPVLSLFPRTFPPFIYYFLRPNPIFFPISIWECVHLVLVFFSINSFPL